MSWKPLLCAVALSALLLAAPSAFAAEVTVAVASNFVPVIQRLKPLFEAEGEDSLTVSSGSTGKLFAQISHGAPFDVFLAADVRRPRVLEDKGLAVAGSRFTYAQGQLVLWSRRSSLPPKPQDALLARGVTHIAMANPRTAPYGQAAREVLKGLGLWRRVQDRLVMGENIAQTYQYVASGNAQVGLVAYSQLRAGSRGGSHWLIPQDLYQPIEQQAVRLNESPGARRFVAFLRSASARKVIRDLGYRVPEQGS